MSNQELQVAIDALLGFFVQKKWKWCDNGSPDGAISQVLAELLHEQERRASYGEGVEV